MPGQNRIPGRDQLGNTRNPVRAGRFGQQKDLVTKLGETARAAATCVLSA